MIARGESKSAKDVALDKPDHNFMVIGASGHCFDPFPNAATTTRMYLNPSEGGKRPMKLIPHASKISTTRIGERGIISL